VPDPWPGVAGVRIRWRGVARAAAIIVVGLVVLRAVPSLLRTPEPPPVPANVGLPKAMPAGGPVRAVRAGPRKARPRPGAKEPRRRSVPDAPAATARVGTESRRHRTPDHGPRPARDRRSAPSKPTLEPIEYTPPPAPEHVPPPAPEPIPTPLPEPPSAPESVPGDGSQEFAPH
jgi:hypothetical protein